MDTQVHKLEIMVVDFEPFGIDDLKAVLEQASNYYMIDVLSAETVETDWDDDHILNQLSTEAQAKRDWFTKRQKEE